MDVISIHVYTGSQKGTTIERTAMGSTRSSCWKNCVCIYTICIHGHDKQ